MSRSRFGTRLQQVFGAWTSGSRRKDNRSKFRRSPRVEILEGRALLTGITASGTITSAASGSNFNYTINLTNSVSSSASIGTFWYAWIPQPFEDFLATKPVSVSPPTGWTQTLTNIGSSDGYGIEYVSSGTAYNVQPGGSLNFSFTSADPPASVNGNSTFYPGTPVGTSFVYSGGPEQGTAAEFVVAPAPTLQSISVTPANTSLATGKTEQFTATGNLSNDTTENLTSQVTWSSSDTTWATINSTGLATAGSPGPVTISAAFDGITGSTGLTVVAPPTLQSIAVTPANTSLFTGKTEQFTATGTLSDDTTENLTSQVTWASSDTTWATINSTGLATAVAPGPVTISAVFDGVTGSTGLTVVAAPTLQSIAVTPANTSLPAGETEQFTATGTLSNNTTENLTSQVTWTSSDTTWATINSAGLATAVSAGPVTISAVFDGVTGTTGLTVSAPVLTSITFTPANTSLVTGTTEQFTVTGTLSNNTTEDLTSQVTWASSNTTSATINTAGLATAVSAGPVTISATFDGVTGSTGLTVVNPPPTLTHTVVTGEQPVVTRKLNKKGKPTGKPVLSGFMLDFGVPLSTASVSNTGIFQLDTVTTKRVKRKLVTVLHPIKKFTVSYVASSNAIEVKLGSAQTFPTGGQLTVLGGVTTASGSTLSGPAVFTISKGGKRIVLS